MLPEQVILETLKTAPLVTAIVAQRIFGSDVLPQNTTFPALNFFEVSGQGVGSMEGSSGLASARYQFSCWSPVKAEALKLRDAVRRSLHGFRTPFEGGELLIPNEAGRAVPGRNEGSLNFLATIDLMVWYTEVKQ